MSPTKAAKPCASEEVIRDLQKQLADQEIEIEELRALLFRIRRMVGFLPAKP